MLKQMIGDGVAKKPAGSNKIPYGPNNRPLPGYQNMSAIIVRLRKPPKYWKDPKIDKIE